MSAFPPPPPPPPPPPTSTVSKFGGVFPPPPPPPSSTPTDSIHPTHAFLSHMVPLSDALLRGLNDVESTHPLAELLYETCMTLRETLNLYAASSPSLLAATAVHTAATSTPASATVIGSASPLPPPLTPLVIAPSAPAPMPRLHEHGLESLFTRTQKVQTMLQQRMWIDRSAMTHRTNVDIALGSVASAGTALSTPQATNLPWSSFVVYKKGHELLALDSAALSSLNVSSTGHLSCSFANASNIAPVLAPAFVSPYKLLLDLRWITGVREVNGANSSSSKEYGCELLLKFVDSLPLGSSHGIAASTGSPTPQPTPERFVHLRFATDGDRQRLANIFRAAAHRNTMQASLAKGSISERISFYRDIGLFPHVTPALASLTQLETAFLFIPKWQDAFTQSSWLSFTGGSTPSTSPVQAVLPSMSLPATPAQAAVSALPFVSTFPVTWPSRESTLLAKHKARVLEVVVYPHQSTPLTLSLLNHTAPTAAWMGRTNVLRIWKHTHSEKSGGSSNSNSGLSLVSLGNVDSVYGRTPMTGVYSDMDDKECSVVLSAGELVDFRANFETLELELTCYVTKHAPKDEGPYNGRSTRHSSVGGAPPPPPAPGPTLVNQPPQGSMDMLLHSKYATRKFIFHSAFHLKKFLDVLHWFQLSHKDPGLERLSMELLELRIREWEHRRTMKSSRASIALLMPPPTAVTPTPGSDSNGAASASAPPKSHLATLFETMYAAHPSSKHCFELHALTRDLPHTKEGSLERLQLLVRKLYACGVTAASIAAALAQTTPTATSQPEKTTGQGPMGDMKAIVCTCAGSRPTAPPSRAPPPSPASGTISAALAAAAQAAGAVPAPPNRPPPATNCCYLLFYQAFLRAHGFQDLLHILTDNSPINSTSGMKRWSLRGVWACFEYVKPLVTASSVPLTGANTGGIPTSPVANANSNMNPSSGNLKTHTSSLDFTPSNSVVSHAQLTSYSLSRCRSKLLSVWEEDSLVLSLPQLFRGNFSACITSLIEPAGKPTTQAAQQILFHESFIDVLFEIAVNTLKIDMIYSTTTTIDPITTFYNPPPAKSGVGLSIANSASAFQQLKREPRVQVLNKPLVHLQVLPLILHLLPFSHISCTVLTLENFTWLLNGNQSNVRELLWNLEIGNGNFGGNLFILLNLANQYMEQLSPSEKSKRSAYSTSLLMNSPVQKGSWDIFLDTALPESSLTLPGDPALIFNLTVTLFTTLHYQSMLVHLNASNLFMGTSASDSPSSTNSAPSSAASTPSHASSAASQDLSSDSTVGSVVGAGAAGNPSVGSNLAGGASNSSGSSSSTDSSERVRFRSNLLFRTMDSLRSLNGWNESTTSVFRVMIICLLNVVRSEARTFTSNFELVNSSSNNFALNQFLVLLYVIEEFIFFRPLSQAVSNTSLTSVPGAPEVITEEDEEFSHLGLHFDFGEDFDWTDIDAWIQADGQNNGISLPIASTPPSTTKSVLDPKGNLGRVLDVPVIDKILDVFVALKLVPSPAAKTLNGAPVVATQVNNTSTVVGDGSADKYEKKILDFFGREYKLWHEYRSMLHTLSKATMSQNHKLQSDQVAELLALVRSHQNDRIKNLTSLANYSKKSSGFFGSAFGNAKTSQALKAGYGIKDANGAGVTLHPHIFGLINKVVSRARSDAASLASSPVVDSSLSSIPASNLATLAALSKPRSRASLIIAQQNRVHATPDPRSESERAASLLKAKRSFQSIRHAKEFCEKERRRSSVFAAGGGSPLVAFNKPTAATTAVPASPNSNTASGISAALSQQQARGNTAPRVLPVAPATPPQAQGPLGGSPTTPTNLLGASPPTGRVFPPPPPTSSSFPPPPPPLPAGGLQKQLSQPQPIIKPPPLPAQPSGAVRGPPPVPTATSASPPPSDGDESNDLVSDLSPTGVTSRLAHGSMSSGAFQCTVCLAPLPASAFWERGGNAYCAQDFIRTFLSCMLCSERIIFTDGAEETQPEREARHRRERDGTASLQYLTLKDERIVHNKCLKCTTCMKALAPPIANMDGRQIDPKATTPLGSVSLFQQAGKYYCQADYFATFGHMCTRCNELISSNQSIQLAPEDEDDDADDARDHRSPPGPIAYYHIECFVCCTCRCDLRALESQQDEADEVAFEQGRAIDPNSRPPVYQCDSQGQVYCWPHWLDVAPNELVRSNMSPRSVSSSSSSSTVPDTPFHSNPLFSGGARSTSSSHSFSAMIRENGVSDFRQSISSAPTSTPGSYQNTGRLSAYHDSFDSNASNSMAPIGEDLDEMELSTSYSRSRS